MLFCLINGIERLLNGVIRSKTFCMLKIRKNISLSDHALPCYALKDTNIKTRGSPKIFQCYRSFKLP